MEKTFYYNVNDAYFTDGDGVKLTYCVPDLFYQENAVWRIFLRDRSNLKCGISNIAAWGAAVDCDYRASTTPMCRALPENIVADAQTGSVLVTLDTATAEFLAAVDGNSRRRAYFALWGLTSGGEREIYLEFEISARMIVDPDPTVSPETPDTVATKNYVQAVVSGGGVSGGIVSGAEFKTSVGDYLLTYTSSGGLMISGGGVALQVSSGGIVASADNGDPGANVGTVISMTSAGGVISGYNIAAGPGHECVATINGDEIIASGASGESLMLSGGTAVLQGATTGDHPVKILATEEEVHIVCSDMNLGDSTDVLFRKGETLIDSHRIYVEPDVTTNTTATSASIDVLSGGTRLIYTQPLTSLCISSVVSTNNEDSLVFTLASGGGISIPASCDIIPEDFSPEGGKDYMMAVLGGAVVIVPRKKGTV